MQNGSRYERRDQAGAGEGVAADHRDGEPVAGGLQQRRVKRRRHRKRQGPLGTQRLRALAGAIDCKLVPGDHDLRGGVVIGRLDHLAGRGGLRARLAHLIVSQAQDGRHAAGAHWNGFLHRLSAKPDQTQRIGWIKAACRGQRGVFAKAVTGNGHGLWTARFAPGEIAGQPRNQHGGLGVDRERK